MKVLTIKNILLLIVGLFLSHTWLACSEESVGLAESIHGSGPKIVWDMERRPLPEIPFPNDIATRYDPSSPTGLRVNLSMRAPTELESRVRRQANKLSGFGTFSPVTVSFDAPLDLSVFNEGHRNRNFEDDVIFLIDITPDSPTYGQPVMLDLGQGFFPAVLPDPDVYFPYDPRAGTSNILFDMTHEDLNDNGILDDGEDSDFDGVLDTPNVTQEGGDPWDDLLTFYEWETNTLIIRPVVPLREETRYAVVLTNRLVGLDGAPVRSPFSWINHPAQTDLLKPMFELIEPYGVGSDDVVFAWAFTTQSITRDMKAIREGLYGFGSLSWLAEEYPPDIIMSPVKDPETAVRTGSLFLLSVQEILDLPILSVMGSLIPGWDSSGEALLNSYDAVDYIVAGTYITPDFLADKDGIGTFEHPDTDDEIFDVDPISGEAHVGPGVVPFVCVIPKEDRELGYLQPFPVALFMHGTAASKVTCLGYASFFARQGIATCAIDAFAHGMPFPKNGLITSDFVISTLESYGYGALYPVLEGTRTRDLDMDGNKDPAGDFWSHDSFHTRDAIRQTVIDEVMLLKILRNFDGERRLEQDLDGDGTNELVGDFNSDGVIDIGGPTNSYYAWGISLGGIVTAVFAGLEPALDAAAPVVGGAGLTDVAIRSLQPGVPEFAILPMLGQLILGEQKSDGLYLKFLIPRVATTTDLTHEFTFFISELAVPGDRVVVTNLYTGEKKSSVISDEGTFRIGIAADALRASKIRAKLGFDPASDDYQRPEIDNTVGLGSRLQIEFFDPDGTLKESISTFGKDVRFNGITYNTGAPLVSLYEGYGYLRGSPELRRFIQIAQTILEPADPANWARHLFLEPLDYSLSDPDVVPGVRVLMLPSVGDNKVPVSTGIAMARCAGIVGYMEEDPRFARTEFAGMSQMEILSSSYVVEGVWNIGRYTPGQSSPNRQRPYPAPEDSLNLDPDNLSQSTDGFNAPILPIPMRAMVTLSGDNPEHIEYACNSSEDCNREVIYNDGIQAMRLTYTEPEGWHGLYLTDPARPFDIAGYTVRLIAYYFLHNGTRLADDPDALF